MLATLACDGETKGGQGQGVPPAPRRGHRVQPLGTPVPVHTAFAWSVAVQPRTANSSRPRASTRPSVCGKWLWTEKISRAPGPVGRGGCRNELTSVTFSPDGKFLAAGGQGAGGGVGTAAGRQGQGQAQRPGDRPRVGHVRPQGRRLLGTRSLAFSPDSKALAAGSENGLTRVWDLRHRQVPVPPARPAQEAARGALGRRRSLGCRVQPGRQDPGDHQRPVDQALGRGHRPGTRRRSPATSHLVGRLAFTGRWQTPGVQRPRRAGQDLGVRPGQERLPSAPVCTLFPPGWNPTRKSEDWGRGGPTRSVRRCPVRRHRRTPLRVRRRADRTGSVKRAVLRTGVVGQALCG